MITTLMIIIFILGILNNVMYSRKDVIEGYKGISTCPNLLVKKEGKFL